MLTKMLWLDKDNAHDDREDCMVDVISSNYNYEEDNDDFQRLV